MVEPTFQRLNRIFVLAFENDTKRGRAKDRYPANVEVKDYNIMADRQNFFGQPIRVNKVTYENIRKIDDYTTGCLLDYPYFKDSCKIIVVNLRKQPALDADPKAI